MVAHFKARGYSYRILKTALEKVSHTSGQETLKYRSKDTATASRPPLVVTHNPGQPTSQNVDERAARGNGPKQFRNAESRP
ncbi:hypothetical protein ACOMHN_004154 [Nucella lapillus]